MPPRMEFFKGAQNFTMGNVEFNTVQGDYHDYSVRNVRNTYGNKNRYYTNNSNSFNDYSNNHEGDYHAPQSHYHGTVNNIERVENANFGENYGTINQGTTTQTGGGGPPRPPPPAGPGYAQGPPPPGPRPGPGPLPNDRDFTASSTAIPQHQGFQQQRGPPNPDPPHPMHRPMSGPPMPEGNQAWQQQQQQRGPPPAFPPSGPQGYPQHPPQNPNFRPTGAPFPPPQQQQQPPPPQQHQRQGSEQWPGQYAYKAGMAHLKQNSPASWDKASSGSSETSDEDGSDTEGPMRRGGQKRMQQTQRMEDPNRPDNVGGGSGASGARLSVGAGVTAMAAGGTRMAVNFGAPQQTGPVPPQGMAFNQGPQHAASPAAPPSRGHSPQPPAARRDPSPAPGPSPQPALQQQQPQQAPSHAAAPVAATEDFLAPPISPLAARLADPRRRSAEVISDEDDDTGSINNGSSSSSPPQDKKKKKKHRNPFSFLSSKKK